MNPLNERVWLALRKIARSDDPAVRLTPMLLVGAPGIGKSFWARHLSEFLSLPVEAIDATSEPASFAITGSQRGWGSAGPGRLVELATRERTANPIMLIDEIEKAGDVTSMKGLHFTLTEALLPFLERYTAASWSCPYFRVAFDMSRVSWIMTANSVDGLGAPFLSRCPPIALERISLPHLAFFARREGPSPQHV
ncbi:AAA family ATPase [Palleronia sp.]|uniref:AAA family ATPase n=1 Tax=Palleronia sp. TaxID=1940284 RepID=UPI0035C79115